MWGCLLDSGEHALGGLMFLWGEGGPCFCLAENFNKVIKVPALCLAVVAKSPDNLAMLTLVSVSVVAFQLFWRIMS